MTKNHLFWFRQDLRLKDNPGLNAALEAAEKVTLIYILDEMDDGPEKLGGASRWWLHESLLSLKQDIANLGGDLVLLRGKPEDILLAFTAEHEIDSVFWNRCYEPSAIARDTAIKSALQAQRVEAKSFNASLLFEPWQIKTQSDQPYKVFTPFWKKGCLSKTHLIPTVSPPPSRIPKGVECESEELDAWELLPISPNWAVSFTESWQPGEVGADAKLQSFLDDGIRGYKELRNRPDLDNVSRLSPHLHWGEVAPWRIWQQTEASAQSNPDLSYKDMEHFFSELGWREFSYHLLYHFPELTQSNWRKTFDAFPWKQNKAALAQWQKGQTGYPIVDAGMRELWQTGWMHNRVRMIVASFLIKDLMIDWREGAAWFWDTLVDADLANNSASWQWVAGSGADAAPYFRIFNPVTQGERFDPEGAYVRRWCPELEKLSNKWIHKPWEADEDTLKTAGVQLGVTYPEPMVNHAEAREAALAAFKALPKES